MTGTEMTYEIAETIATQLVKKVPVSVLKVARKDVGLRTILAHGLATSYIYWNTRVREGTSAEVEIQVMKRFIKIVYDKLEAHIKDTCASESADESEWRVED